MSSFSGLTFVLFCFIFVFFLPLKPRPFVQSFFVLRCTCAPTATRNYLTTVCVFLFLFLPFCCFFGGVAFSEYFCTIPVFLFVTDRPGGSVRNLETFWRWGVSSNLGAVTRTGKWRTIISWGSKNQLHGRRGKGTAEPFSRYKLRQAPQKEGGEILCDVPPV